MDSSDIAPLQGASVKRSGLWMDQPDALAQLLTRAGNDVVLQKVGRDLIEDGFTVIEGLQDPALIAQTNADYDRWLEDNREEAEKNRDPNGRQFRLTNFHLASPSAMKLAKNAEVMRILDFIFGREAAVHTSLTFQYSTMQALHRDAPYFHTFPENQFVGVWTALQDIDPDSGPLSYIRGSHRFTIDQHAYYREALEQLGDPELARGAALARYQNEITEIGEAMAPRTYGLLKRGDVAIWHPQLVHGGSPAVKPELKRRSMVVHCCPADTHVYIDDAFLAHQEETPPQPYYQYATSDGRSHGDFRVPGFMASI
ncbi:MAG: hypothetical protein EBR82_19985 [Caulobacteraceae bacterium]|nr:hypothetical protein [Caulobacteraceae bacterium]